MAGDLDALSLSYLLPMLRSVRYYGRSKTTVEVPMFMGYVFFRGRREDVYNLDRAKRLAAIIPVSDQAGLNDELQQLCSVMQQGGLIQPHPYLRVGVQVEVRSGPFRGVRGVVAELGRNDRLILQIKALGQATSLEINGALLDPIETHALAS